MTYFGFTLAYYDIPTEFYYWSKLEDVLTEDPVDGIKRPVVPVTLVDLIANTPRFLPLHFADIMYKLYSKEIITAHVATEALAGETCEEAYIALRKISSEERVKEKNKEERIKAENQRRIIEQDRLTRQAKLFTPEKLRSIISEYLWEEQSPFSSVGAFMASGQAIQINLTPREYYDLLAEHNVNLCDSRYSALRAWAPGYTFMAKCATSYGLVEISLISEREERGGDWESFIRGYFPSYGQESWRVARR